MPLRNWGTSAREDKTSRTQGPNSNSQPTDSAQHVRTATDPVYRGFNLQTTQTLYTKHNDRVSLETHSALQHVCHRFTNTDWACSNFYKHKKITLISQSINCCDVYHNITAAFDSLTHKADFINAIDTEAKAIAWQCDQSKISKATSNIQFF